MIKVGVIGASGYSGFELIKLLLNHPEVTIKNIFGVASAGKKLENIYPYLKNVFTKEIEIYDQKSLNGLDCIFIALPSGQSMPIMKEILNHNIIAIDLGGDFRLRSSDEYAKYYKQEHTEKALLPLSVYGLPEWNYENIKSAKLVVNPGCYPTSVLLALLPLLKSKLIMTEFVSVSSYSGTSGAGKSLSKSLMFSEVNESVKAYKIGVHQHIPEIRQYAFDYTGENISFSFVPHLLPITKGIYTTIQTRIKAGVTLNDINESFMNKYSSKRFIRLLKDEIPELKNVVNTNFCDIGYNLSDNNLTVISTIDNLIKGAAGQAIQNMNIIYNLPEETGILPCKTNQ
ncbi:MAG: N-acetyl-gamma-glutamyl-phosphate reductase [Ignavibacteriales bacterium CG_4_9_14_3_um_filter_34_10]|nr:MAG: N-acetyl-gamma-glutamyl-phosphate reductase [Ignavibacteriales bacterium CG_4_9_14_3_um_filter_34_10]